ncbi:MAG: hypothetical protein PHH01_02635 [Patescibacteria group bacterium]|nr:hypothetical protein [Patescibacteria group bacterium]
MSQRVSELIWNGNLRLQRGLDFWIERIGAIRRRNIGHFVLGAFISGVVSLVFYFFILVILALFLGINIFTSFLPRYSFYGLVLVNTVVAGLSLAVNLGQCGLNVTGRQTFLTAFVLLAVLSIIIVLSGLMANVENLGHPALWIFLVALGGLIPACSVKTFL